MDNLARRLVMFIATCFIWSSNVAFADVFLLNQASPAEKYKLAQQYEHLAFNMRHGYKPVLKKALGLYMESAQSGYIPAEEQLGSIYAQHTATLYGVRKDTTKAMFWLHKAADGGSMVSAGMLGEVYKKYNKVTAAKWLFIAETGRNGGLAKLDLHGFLPELSKQQITVAYEMAREWLNKHE